MKPCPACRQPLTPGAYCAEGHLPRRAPRLTATERDEARREAAARAVNAQRLAAARREYRGVLEVSAHRRWLYRRGELRADLDACIKAGILSEEDAHRLEAETADAVVEEAYARARRDVEREAREAARVEASPEAEEPEPPREPAPRRPYPASPRALLSMAMFGLLLGATSSDPQK